MRVAATSGYPSQFMKMLEVVVARGSLRHTTRAQFESLAKSDSASDENRCLR